jgi:hypothetical protein
MEREGFPGERPYGGSVHKLDMSGHLDMSKTPFRVSDLIADIPSFVRTSRLRDISTPLLISPPSN